MNQTNRYIAITLGPIGRVASYAEDTKGIWASSYLFVYIAKQVIKPMYEKRDFLLPQWSPTGTPPGQKEVRMFEPQQGAGLCPDRYIFKAEEGDFDELAETCNLVYQQTATKIAESCTNTDKKEVERYLKHSIKIYFCEQEFRNDIQEQEIINKCTAMLDAMECEDLFPQQETRNYFKEFFNNVNGSFLTKDAYKTKNNNEQDSRLIKTIFEYSASDLEKKMNKKEILEIASGKNDTDIPTRYKYIAIVKADGDNMGDTLKNIYNSPDHTIHNLDKQLLEYNLQVGNLIREFSGVPIFTGGDDLLFFAPIVYNGNTIFKLLQDIDNAFNSCMKAVGTDTVPTLSFGLSMSYYKFPMFEAVQLADTLLQKAKSDFPQKNRIIWSLRKHSGQTIDGMIDKNNPDLYKDEINLIQKSLDISKEKDWLSSVAYWLIKEQDMLTDIIDNEKQLEAYIENNFNEDIHSKEKGQLLKQITDFLKKHFLSQSIETERKVMLSTLCSTLRFISFINKV